MRFIEIFIVVFMSIATPVSVFNQGNASATIAAQDGGDMDERTHP